MSSRTEDQKDGAPQYSGGKRTLDPTERAECAAFAKAFHDFNASRDPADRLSQERVALELGMTQGALNAYLKGRNPLNLKLAGGIFKVCGIPVQAYSPRLATELATLAEMISPAQSEAPSARLRHAIDRMDKAVTGLLESSPLNFSEAVCRLECARDNLMVQAQ